MCPIVTDVERAMTTPRPVIKERRLLRRVGVPALTVVTVLSSTVLGLARPPPVTHLRRQGQGGRHRGPADAGAEPDVRLSQQYDAAEYHLSQINSNIQTTKANIAADQQQVSNDKATLSKAAVANYISNGTASTQNPIFSGNQETLGATTEYNQIAEGDISLAVDNLHTAENQLNAQQAQLTGEQTQAQTQVNAEQAAVAPERSRQSTARSALSQEQGQIATSSKQQQQAEAAAAAKAAAASGSSRGRRRGRGRGRASSSAGGSASWPAPRQRRPAADRPRRRGSGAGRREPDRRPLRLGRRVPKGSASPASTARASPPGPGARSASACRITRAPRWPTRPRCRSATSSRATSSSTAPVVPSTWPCTSAPGR